MTALLASGARTVLARTSIRCNHILTIVAPDGAIRRASRTLCSAQHGIVRGSIAEWGGIDPDTSGLDGGLQALETRVRYSDQDGTLAARLAAGEALEGSRAYIDVALGTDVAYTDWPRPFDGVLERIERADSREFDLILRVPDLPLRRDLVGLVRFTESDWPRVAQVTKATQDPKPDNVLGEYVPVYYGAWNSASAGSGGSVPSYNVDTRANGNNGWCPMRYGGTVQRVYDAGVESGASNWAVTTPSRNGKTFTLVSKVTGRFTGPVTMDIEGVQDGSGDLITNPARQLEHALDYLAWGGSGLAPIDDTWFDLVADMFDDVGIRGSFRVDAREAGIDMLNRWLASWPFLRAVWGVVGGVAKIQIYPCDWRDWTAPADWLRYWPNDDGTRVQISYDRERMLSDVRVKYLSNAIGGALRTLSCANPDAPFGSATEELPADALMATFG